MFTGIVTDQGRIRAVERNEEGATFVIESGKHAPALSVGDSVSIDGVCLTVVRSDRETFAVEITPETLRLTNMDCREQDDRVNLEVSARLTDFLSGHLVQGHVDQTGQVKAIHSEGNSYVFRISAPPSILRHCALKGSIAVNGVSLTISRLGPDWFEVTIIPHTFQVTNLGRFKVGEKVNLEADIISKYVEQHVRRLITSIFLVMLGSMTWLQGADVEIAANTILIYENTTAESSSQIVVRIARYQPDIVLEWENRSDQGTVQLFRRAVDSATRFTLAGLFEAGVDRTTGNEMTIWLSRVLYDGIDQGKVRKMSLNRLPLVVQSLGIEKVEILVDGKSAMVEVQSLSDNRKGHWLFLDERENPLLIRYSSPFYMTKLSKVIHAQKNPLRWIKSLPPIQ